MAPSFEQQDLPAKIGTIGWREWLSLPALNIPQVKAKVDTGARSSALHAFNIEYFEADNGSMVRFSVHPLQRDSTLVVTATAPLLDKRSVKDSGGHIQERPVVKTLVALGSYRWPIELTLTNRDVMGFRMLLGREAVRRRFLVDPGKSYCLSQSEGSTLSHPAEVDEPDLP